MPRPRIPETAAQRPRAKPASGRSDPKKLGTRIANLESQLGLAQEELKSLKDQLVSTKKTTQDQPQKKPNNHTEVKHSQDTLSMGDENSSDIITYKTSDEDNNNTTTIQGETDVFEVTVEKLADEPKSATADEINSLKADLVEKEKEVEVFRQENERLKSQLDEEALKAEAEIEELTQELEKTKTGLLEKDGKLESSEKEKMELEKEMNRLRVQSEQWRKAADAAASVLEINGQRLSERCGSMDKVYMNGYVGSPGLGGDSDYVFGGDKPKSSGGIKNRMLGELWKKKAQK